MGRTPPADVKRQLRKEANYGCIVCGKPLIQYHHIVPYSEEEHHDPDRMAALCYEHHAHAGPEAEALTPEDIYEYKEDPYNSSEVDYPFHFESSRPEIKLVQADLS